jgi:outer membrane lipoprotein LolB
MTGTAGSRHGRRCAITAIVLAALLTACASRPPRADRTAWRPVAAGDEPAHSEHFRLAGRLAVSDGRDGGSAGFVWVQRGEHYEVELRQPVSQRTWRLRGDRRGATLEGDGRGPRRAGSAEVLLRELLGWEVPVTGLRHWLRGLVVPAQQVSVERDGRGRLSAFEQDGWRVEYRDWLSEGLWPVRMQARQASYSVRVQVHDWAIAR